MDPNANLAGQIELANAILLSNAILSDTGAFDMASGRLAELVLAMNEWLSSGGFKPAAWEA